MKSLIGGSQNETHMTYTILDQIPFHITPDDLKRRLNGKPKPIDTSKLEAFVIKAQALIRPKAIYQVSDFEVHGDHHTTINGIELKSHVLKVNIEKTSQVFPFIATCGMEFENWCQTWTPDESTQEWRDAVKSMALQAALDHLEKDILGQFQLEQISHMSPGSILDWPIEEQHPLFEILGEPAKKIDVTLQEDMMMVPGHSVSGIMFPTRDKFIKCRLCPWENCPDRRGSYQPEIYDQKYKLAVRPE